jgi:NitT/TauT family transport system substrate-binding protein
MVLEEDPMRRMRVTLAISAAVLLLVATCGGSGSGTPPATSWAPASAATQAQATKPARATVKVSVGSAASLIYLPWDLAKALNYFEDENLDVQLNYAAAGTEAATALLSGSVDFTGNSLDHSIKAQIAGKPTKMLVAFAKLPGTALIVRGDLKDTVKSVKDLKGQTVGATSVGSGTHLLLTFMMNQAGLVQDKDYTFKPCGSGTMAATLDSKGAAACMNSDPFITAYVNAGKGFVLAGGDLRTDKDTTGLLGGAYQFTGAVTTQDFITKNPGIVQRVVNALVKADRFIGANAAKDIAAKLPDAVTGADRDLYVKALDIAKGYLSVDGIIDQKGVDNVLKLNIEDCKNNPTLCPNLQPTDKVDSAALFDNSFAQKVPK